MFYLFVLSSFHKGMEVICSVSNRQLSRVDQMDSVYTPHYDKSFLLARDKKPLKLP